MDFKESDNEELLWLRDEENWSWSALEKHFNTSQQLLKNRYSKLIQEDIAREKAKHAGETNCLKCKKKFQSEHKRNIRFCDTCRSTNKEMANNMVEAVSFGR